MIIEFKIDLDYWQDRTLLPFSHPQLLEQTILHRSTFEQFGLLKIISHTDNGLNQQLLLILPLPHPVAFTFPQTVSLITTDLQFLSEINIYIFYFPTKFFNINKNL